MTIIPARIIRMRQRGWNSTTIPLVARICAVRSMVIVQYPCAVWMRIVKMKGMRMKGIGWMFVSNGNECYLLGDKGRN